MHDDGREFVFLVSPHDAPVAVELPAGAGLSTLDGAAVDAFKLRPTA